jgi:8-hydroxy-5-deazaflavin:NADPH oxidoreductase
VSSLGVVGSGRMGEALVRMFSAHVPDLVWIGRDPERLSRRLGELDLDGVRALDHRAGVEAADILVLAVWHRDALEFVRTHRDALQGRIVVDIANPFTEDFSDFTLREDTSAAEELAAIVPGARVVGALKNTFWVVLEDPEVVEGESDVLVTADDEDAKQAVIALFDQLPFRAVDAGRLSNSRTVERMTLLSREIAIRYGHYPRVTWRLLGQPAR